MFVHLIEEERIPKLINSINNNSTKPYEIILCYRYSRYRIIISRYY